MGHGLMGKGPRAPAHQNLLDHARERGRMLQVLNLLGCIRQGKTPEEGVLAAFRFRTGPADAANRSLIPAVPILHISHTPPQGLHHVCVLLLVVARA
jgi:hypothetical protein